MKFTKMQGLGNDYIYIDCTKKEIDNPSNLSIQLSNRNFGIGSDGLVLICSSDIADFKMRMFNSDGSEAEMCGNAIRCVGKYVYDKELTNKKELSIETLAGIKFLELQLSKLKVIGLLLISSNFNNYLSTSDKLFTIFLLFSYLSTSQFSNLYFL